MKEKVKHIIFDLGGVILNIDYLKPQLALEALGISTINTLYSKQEQIELFDQLETGKISGHEFIQTLKGMTKEKVSDKELIDAWNSIILDFPLRRLQILQQLQLHYNIFLLSNTNEIHEEAFNHLLFQTCGYPSLGVFFDKVYLSHRVGLRKPNPEIFNLVLNENNLKASETLFMDDSIQHIEAASKLGIQTLHIMDGMVMEQAFAPQYK